MAIKEFTTKDASSLVVSDVIVQIDVAWQICRYYGTCSQLQNEGLIPAGFKWPERKNRAYFEDAKFTYWIERTRQPGTKGSISTWIKGDYWVLDVSIKGERGDYITWQIREKMNEMVKLNMQRTPEWKHQWHQCYTARKDSKYMQFRDTVLGDMAPRKRGRPKMTLKP